MKTNPRRVADYVLEESLGAGNYGTFYRARRPERLDFEQEYVIVKLLESSATDEQFRRVASELRVLASMDSDYIGALIDAGIDGSQFFYAMVDYGAGTLADASTRLTSPARLRVVADAARGAHALHEAGIAHRDIRPGTIVLDGDGSRLFDLGLAQFLTPGLTTGGNGPVGSIEFIHPALIRGRKASRCSDIWSLGVTLHKTLTGQGVFPDIPNQNLVSALSHIADTPPQLSADLDPVAAEIVRRCLDTRHLGHQRIDAPVVSEPFVSARSSPKQSAASLGRPASRLGSLLAFATAGEVAAALDSIRPLTQGKAFHGT